jgi:hypothetical protein
LEVVVICGYQDGQGQEGNAEDGSIGRGSPMAEGGVEHDTGGINHGELVDQLPWICGKMSAADQLHIEGEAYT